MNVAQIFRSHRKCFVKVTPDFWQSGNLGINRAPNADSTIVDSPRAGGRYEITGSAAAIATHLTISEKVSLTCWLVSQRKQGVEIPVITSEIINLSKQSPAISVTQRRDNLLIAIGQRAPKLGQEITYRTRYFAIEKNRKPDPHWQSRDYLLAVTASADIEELDMLAQFAKDQGLLYTDKYVLRLTFDGLKRIEDIKLHPSISLQAFVAMWFGDEVASAYLDGFAPAIRDAGYQPMRIDQKEHNNKIDDEIIAEIRRSRFVVADFTCSTLSDQTGKEISIPRGGVYYEAGFAQGLGIPVIWCCRSDQIQNVHFDTRQFNHITWNTPADLREKLKNRIGAVIGDGPLREVRG